MCVYTRVNLLAVQRSTVTVSGDHTCTGRITHTHTHTRRGLTSREGELNLLLDDLQSDEVVFLVKSAVVEKQSVSFSAGEPAKTNGIVLFEVLYS